MKAILSIPEAADAIGIGQTKLYHLIGTGQLRAVKLGRRTMILAKDIEDFLDTLPDWGNNGDAA